MATHRHIHARRLLVRVCLATALAVSGVACSSPRTDPPPRPAEAPSLQVLNAPLPDGLTDLVPADRDRITAACTGQTDFRGPTDDVTLRALTDYREPLTHSGVAGYQAVLVGSQVILLCRLDEPTEPGSPMHVTWVGDAAVRPVDGVAANWLPGVVQVDYSATNLPPGPESDGPRPGAHYTEVGRVTDDVATVVVDAAGGQRVTVAVSGGAFAATVFVSPTTTPEFIGQPPPVVHALSADGTELGRTDGTVRCSVDPAGNVVIGQPLATPCSKAVPWP